MITVYAIKSLSRNYIYVGMSNNVHTRFTKHNSRKNRTTKAYLPFFLIFQEEFENRIQAREKEKYLKSGVGKEFLRSLKNINYSDALP